MELHLLANDTATSSSVKLIIIVLSTVDLHRNSSDEHIHFLPLPLSISLSLSLSPLSLSSLSLSLSFYLSIPISHSHTLSLSLSLSPYLLPFSSLSLPHTHAHKTLSTNSGICSNTPEDKYLMNSCVSAEVSVELSNDGEHYSGIHFIIIDPFCRCDSIGKHCCATATQFGEIHQNHFSSRHQFFKIFFLLTVATILSSMWLYQVALKAQEWKWPAPVSYPQPDMMTVWGIKLCLTLATILQVRHLRFTRMSSLPSSMVSTQTSIRWKQVAPS